MIIEITGPPNVGKSKSIPLIESELREQGYSVLTLSNKSDPVKIFRDLLAASEDRVKKLGEHAQFTHRDPLMEKKRSMTFQTICLFLEAQARMAYEDIVLWEHGPVFTEVTEHFAGKVPMANLMRNVFSVVAKPDFVIYLHAPLHTLRNRSTSPKFWKKNSVEMICWGFERLYKEHKDEWFAVDAASLSPAEIADQCASEILNRYARLHKPRARHA